MTRAKTVSRDEKLQKIEESLLAANQRLKVFQKITSAAVRLAGYRAGFKTDNR
ncbi:hypothetical protein ACFLYM_00095 [Chloroflexota bacterium]